MTDQAESLRRQMLIKNNKARIVTVTSGKGGVGKSSIALNLAIALNRRGHSALIIDTDFGFSNIDVMLGVRTKYDLTDVIARRRQIRDIIETGLEGVQFIAGGSGVYELDKTFTEIELSIIERVIRKVLSLMSEAWDRINRISVQLDRIETSSQYVQIVSANEPIAIITMNVKIGNVSDIINICIPNVAVQPIAKKLVMKTWYAEHNFSQKGGLTKELKQGLSAVTLSLKAVFNDVDATVKEIMGTQVGDVIRIDHTIDTPVTVNIEHMPKFKGFIGMHGSNYAIKVTDILKENTQNEPDV